MQGQFEPCTRELRLPLRDYCPPYLLPASHELDPSSLNNPAGPKKSNSLTGFVCAAGRIRAGERGGETPRRSKARRRKYSRRCRDSQSSLSLTCDRFALTGISRDSEIEMPKHSCHTSTRGNNSPPRLSLFPTSAPAANWRTVRLSVTRLRGIQSIY